MPETQTEQTPFETDARAEHPDANGEDLFQQLLDNVTSGEELIDPRVGVHDQAHLLDVELATTNSGGYVAKMRWGDMTDKDGNTFELTDRVNLPTPESNPVGHKIFLAMLHDLGVVPRTHKKAVLVADEKQAVFVVGMLQKVADKGLPWSVNITEDNSGFMRLRIRRSTVRKSD